MHRCGVILIVVGAAIAVCVVAYVFIQSSRDGDHERIVCGEITSYEAFTYADLIVTGDVFAIVPGDQYAQILFTPDWVYKGMIPDTGIQIASTAVDDTVKYPRGDVAPDLHFTSSDPPYLLYLRRRDDGTFSTSRCYGSRLLGAGLTADERVTLGDGQEVKNQ